MERVGMLNNVNAGILKVEKMENIKIWMKKETIDMRNLINMFKERDFKLWRCFEAFDKGWSFSSINCFSKDGRSIM